MSEIAPLHRTLESELFALLRGASLECLVCGEFVLHREGELACPECEMSVALDETASAAEAAREVRAG